MDNEKINAVKNLQEKIIEKLNGILSMDYPFTEEASTDEDKMESEVVLNLVRALNILDDITRSM